MSCNELSLVLRMHFQPPVTAACQTTVAPNLLLPQRHEVEEVGTESPLALLPLRRPTPGLCGYGSRRRNPRRPRVRAVDEPLWNNRWVIWFVESARQLWSLLTSIPILHLLTFLNVHLAKCPKRFFMEKALLSRHFQQPTLDSTGCPESQSSLCFCHFLGF